VHCKHLSAHTHVGCCCCCSFPPALSYTICIPATHRCGPCLTSSACECASGLGGCTFGWARKLAHTSNPKQHFHGSQGRQRFPLCWFKASVWAWVPTASPAKANVAAPSSETNETFAPTHHRIAFPILLGLTYIGPGAYSAVRACASCPCRLRPSSKGPPSVAAQLPLRSSRAAGELVTSHSFHHICTPPCTLHSSSDGCPSSCLPSGALRSRCVGGEGAGRRESEQAINGLNSLLALPSVPACRT